jgi:hypothetical protein
MLVKVIRKGRLPVTAILISSHAHVERNGVPLSECRFQRERQMRQQIFNGWNFIFNAEVSPLRHIPDVATRHYVLQALGLMWAITFAVAIGSYTILAASIIGHTVLIGAAAITVATYTAAATKPKLFAKGSGRRADGEHE